MKEKEIENILKEKYKKIVINVEFVSFREYNIKIGIEYKAMFYETLLSYKYDSYLSIDENCDRIGEIIDNIILSFYKGCDII